MKRSILRTARHHRDLDRNLRVQHGKGPTDEQRLAAIKKAKADPDNGRKPSVILIQYQGYHRCTCRACSLARGHWARQTVKAIVRYLENYRDENGLGIKIDLSRQNIWRSDSTKRCANWTKPCGPATQK